MSNFNGKRRRKRKREGDPRPKYTIYSDGSANNKGGAGYFSLIYRNNILVCYCAGGQPINTLVTAPQAELYAIQLATYELVEVNEPIQVMFVSDSTYAIGAIFDMTWRIKKNRELVYDIKDAIQAIEANGSTVKSRHVPRTEKHIQVCDKYANIWRKKEEFSLVTHRIFGGEFARVNLL